MKKIKGTDRMNEVPSDLLGAWISQAAVGHALLLGAGTGETAKWLALRGFRVDAIETDKSACDRMRKICHGLAVRLFSMDLLAFPYPERRYSLIVAEAVLHFFLPTDLWRIADRLTASLRTGGILIANVFTRDDPGYDALIEDGVAQVQPNTFLAPPPVHLIHYFETDELRRTFQGLTVLFFEEARVIDACDPGGFRSGARLVARRD